MREAFVDSSRAASASRLPVGCSVPGWQARPWPAAAVLHGSLCRLEPLALAQHADALFAAYRSNADGSDWTYQPVGPFACLADYRAYVAAIVARQDALHYAVVDPSTGLALGTCALLRPQPEHGVIELGSLAFSPALQGTRMGTLACFLLLSHVFDALGYRRCEWKCDSLNARSRKAAQRLGFAFEGIFRQAAVYKGRNRDTAWFALTDKAWPQARAALLAWLRAENFDAGGRQLERLRCLREQLQRRARACGNG